MKKVIPISICLILLIAIGVFAGVEHYQRELLSEEKIIPLVSEDGVIFVDDISERDLQDMSQYVERANENLEDIENWGDVRPNFIDTSDPFTMNEDGTKNIIDKSIHTIEIKSGLDTIICHLALYEGTGNTFVNFVEPSLAEANLLRIDSMKYLIYTYSDIKMIGVEKGELIELDFSVKSEQDMSYEELKEIGLEQEIVLYPFMFDHLSISPDNRYVSYSSNRDGIVDGDGMYSIYALDLETQEEVLLMDGSIGYHCINKFWVDDKHIMFAGLLEGSKKYYIVDIATKDMKEIYVDDSFEISDSSGDYVCFFNEEQILISEFNDFDKSFNTYMEIKVNGYIRNRVHFNLNGNYIAYEANQDNNSPSKQIVVVNILNGEELIIPRVITDDLKELRIHSFEWIGEKELFIIAHEVEEGMVTESSWIYSIEEGMQ